MAIRKPIIPKAPLPAALCQDGNSLLKLFREGDSEDPAKAHSPEKLCVQPKSVLGRSAILIDLFLFFSTHLDKGYCTFYKNSEKKTHLSPKPSLLQRKQS